MQLKRRPQGVKPPQRLNVNKLKIGPIKQSFAATLEERLESIVLDDQDVEAAWGVLRETVYNTATDGVPWTHLQKT